MLYCPKKEPKHYKDSAEWLLIKLGVGGENQLKVANEYITFLASAMADVYNSGYDQALLDLGKLNR